ncbi:MAG: DUF362 domain-containing protein [Nitrospiraceae bacterium]|nr:MAG: DUF362 domain-containing protein [Nitrospiraceae bacterium]
MKTADVKPDVFLSRLKKGQSRRECFAALLGALEKPLADFGQGSFVGIKMTVGDEASTGFIKPELVRVLVENLKSRGAKPFVFDTNVIYSGQRQNAVDHLNLAYRKGFTPDALGCPYIIADSVFGTDSRSVRTDFRHTKEIKVPSLITALDHLIVLSHVTGHVMSGFAGSVKNVAMGMASRAGKQIQHSSLKPYIKTDNCTLCGACIDHCPVSAIAEVSGKAYINSRICIGCCECISACKVDAVGINWKEDADIFAERMAEYACAILSLIRNRLFFNFALDVTRECDCIAGNDASIAPDTGIFVSLDVLAADRACYDLLTTSRDIFSRGGKIRAHLHEFAYAEEIGLGKGSYRLIEVRKSGSGKE